VRFLRNKLKVADIIQLKDASVIGILESRDVLEKEYPSFAASRREELDRAIEAYANDPRPGFPEFPNVEEFQDNNDEEF